MCGVEKNKYKKTQNKQKNSSAAQADITTAQPKVPLTHSARPLLVWRCPTYFISNEER